MKARIADALLPNNHFGIGAWRYRWVGLAVGLGLLSLAWAQDPRITSQPTNQSVSLGGTATFRVTATTTNYPLSFQWQYSELPGGPKIDLPGATRNPLQLTNVTAAQAGYYSVIASNVIGNCVTSQVATLNVDPTFTQITTGPLVEDTAGGWGACWVDYDGDGNLDVTVAPGWGPGLMSVFHNQGDGTFRKDTTNAIARASVHSYAHLWGDYDNDGNLDLFVPETVSNDLLFRNNGSGSFTRITGRHPTIDGAASGTGVWGDYDRDGFLDLFVTTYGSCPGQKDILYRSNGDGTFRKMTSAEVGPFLDQLAVNDVAVWVDMDNDGWPELYRMTGDACAADWWQHTTNEVYHLDREGRFNPMDIGEMAMGTVGATLVAWGDYDNDGFLDGAVSVQKGSIGLYRNLAGQGFTNVTASAFPITLTNSVVVFAGDYDNDGWLDIVVSKFNTRLITLYRNNGDGTFTPRDLGGPTSSPPAGLVWGDYNNDGFLDVLGILGPGIRNLLWRHNGNANHWLKVKLDGRASNRPGIGAKVRVLATIGGRTFWQLREISAQGAAGLDNGLLAHFGLGDATKVDRLRIEWPSGIVQEFQDLAVDQKPCLTVVESQNPDPSQHPQVIAQSCDSSGVFRATVNYPAANARCVLEASTDLVHWTKVQVRTSAPPAAMEFTDAGPVDQPARFYRVVVP